MDEHRLDGNAAGGILGDIFSFEMTLAETACAGCGAVARIGACVVYAHGMGTVVRCASCDDTLIRLARRNGDDHYWLDLRGVEYLKIEERA